MDAKSRAATALGALCLPVRAHTVAALAERLGVKRQAVYAWLEGSSRPRLEIAVRIEREFGIPVIDWAEESTVTPTTQESTR